MLMSIFRSSLQKKGIEHDLSPPYSPESNGVAERLNRSIGEGIRAMLQQIKDKRLWAEAVNTFIYTKNIRFHKTLGNLTPHEEFYGEKPSIEHLQPFGRLCYVHTPKENRHSGSKLISRAKEGMFVGYTKVIYQYRIFIPAEKRTVVSADVKFRPITLQHSPSPSPSPSYS